MDAGDLIVGERSIGHLAAVEVHLLEQREAELHQRGAGNLRLHDLRIDRIAAVDHVDQSHDAQLAGLGVHLDLGAGAGGHPEWRRVGRLAGLRIGRHIVRLVGAGADDVARLHAVFLADQLGERNIAAVRLADFARHGGDLGFRLFGGEPHRVPHVEQRARAERAHVVGRHITVARHHADRFRRHVEHFADHLRHGGVGALAHVDGAAIDRDAAIAGDVDDGHRRGRRDYRF